MIAMKGGRRLPEVRPLLPVVVQHVQELAVLWNTRTLLVRGGALTLTQLSRCDERIAAHQDGCVVAGASAARKLVEETIEPGLGPLFAAAVVALGSKDLEAFAHCVATVESIADRWPALVAAMGWIEKSRLVGIGASLIHSGSVFRRRLALAACRLQHADPGSTLRTALVDQDVNLRAEGLRLVGTLGREEFLPLCGSITSQGHTDEQWWAAWSSVLLGNRGAALEVLTNLALVPGAHRARAFRVALQAMTVGDAHGVLQSLQRDPKDLRRVIQGGGIVGDPTYVPWLISHMSNDQTARLAGESFSLITGADLAWLDLERKPPENFESGPNDDPSDPNVEMDPDDGLPWPDPERINGWWTKNGNRFTPGTRYFMGAPVTRAHCIDVLKNGYQRQRILAAHYLCLLDPGTPLFNTSAPAWRQQKLLAQMV
jgi:uncharacterized protein (TIGR02270 family)